MRGTRVAKWTLGLMVFAAAATSVAATAVNTLPYWDGSNGICCFGPPDTQTYGQVITVPVGETSLTSFRFTIDDQGTPATFLAEVYQWDGVNSHTTGPNLFESGPMTTPGVAGYQPYTVTIPGGVPVTAGQTYVIFFTTSKSVQTGANLRWAFLNSDVYNGGDFVFNNNGNNFALLATTGWAVTTGNDAAFGVGFGGASIDVNQIPMLSGRTLLMLGAALALVGVIVLRFRHS